VHHVGILYDQFMMHGQRNIKAYMGGHDLVVAGGLLSIPGHHHSEWAAAKGNSVSQHVAPFHATFRRLSTLCSLLSFAFTHSDPEMAFLFLIREFGFVFRYGVSTSSLLQLASSAIKRRTWSVRSLRMSVILLIVAM